MMQRMRIGLVVGLGVLLAAGSAPAEVTTDLRGVPPPRRPMGFLDVITDSLAGPVYEPGRWKPLTADTFFSEGWDEPWAGGPNGQGGSGAPRQGWLNAAEGVFYRLGIATVGYADDTGNGSRWTSGVTLFTPLNRRFELRWDLPLIYSSRGVNPPGSPYEITSPDFQLAPRFAISETESSAQSLDITFRMPTGDVYNGQGQAAVTPFYNFWVNPWERLVLRGGVGFGVPFGNQSVNVLNARSTFLGNFAFGYYFTDHDLTPIGDMVWYVATNLSQAIDHRGANTTTLTFTPGFRTHLGDNWYLLGGTEIPATQPEGFDYQVLGGLMKVW
jgi:hypothetical protein